MLEKVDLSKNVDKDFFKEVGEQLKLRLGALQRKIVELKIPVMIVFEGWDGAQKGLLINELILPMDPRGFKVHPIQEPTEEEKMHPFLWRFWTKTPGEGRIEIFDRSWYGRVLTDRVEGIVKEEKWMEAYPFIKSFERQLNDEGTVIIKFFLHISKEEQKKRFKKIEKNPALSWKVTKKDWKHHKKYEEYLEASEEMIERTDTDFAPWTIIEAHDHRFATLKIYKTVIKALEAQIEKAQIKKEERPIIHSSAEYEELNSSILDKVDLSKDMKKDAYKKELKKCQERIREIEHQIYTKRIPVIILYEGWDAAGKGGNIRRLVKKMDPRGYEVIPIAAPNDIEKAHHYLWRFWNAIPKAGHIAIFDRTWYGRVLVERVEGFATKEQWKRAYQEINEMEQQLVSDGAVIIKFWLHIDKEEQLKRFKDRQEDPNKTWKITDEDWRNREKWNEYKKAVDEMLLRTGTTYAPWTIVESNTKYYARIKVLKTVISKLEKYLS